MNYLLSNLYLSMAAPPAGAGGSGGGSMVTTVITFGLVILIFYFMIIRPQSKKQKETKNMLAALKAGDKVVTIGGIRGVIHSVKDETVIIKVDDNAKLEFSRSAVATIIERS
ncbi:MAG: preprotein translocase subunit YajC [Spirochaetales bacterium]|jgi:preprotein translocase subunit YajC|nr:preprotein translocase subunit YajC [Spirochaetales bacterium]